MSIARQASVPALVRCLRAFSETDFRPDMAAFTLPTLIRYRTGDMPSPDLMRVRELWRDEQALRDHFATPHMATFLAALRDLRPRSVSVKCYELGPERPMPNAG